MQAGVSSPGTADSFLKVTHVTCTCRVHQVTVTSLTYLLHKAYTQYSSSMEDNDQMSIEDWSRQRAESSPQSNFGPWYYN